MLLRPRSRRLPAVTATAVAAVLRSRLQLPLPRGRDAGVEAAAAAAVPDAAVRTAAAALVPRGGREAGCSEGACERTTCCAARVPGPLGAACRHASPATRLRSLRLPRSQWPFIQSSGAGGGCREVILGRQRAQSEPPGEGETLVLKGPRRQPALAAEVMAKHQAMKNAFPNAHHHSSTPGVQLQTASLRMLMPS